MSEPKQQITVYMPVWLIAAIKRVAVKERRSMNQEIIRAIEVHIKQQEGQNP